MANPRIRGRVAVWGIEASAGDTFAAGLITGQGRKVASDQDVLLDLNGFVIAQIFFNQNDECSVNVICEADTEIPEAGDDIQIAGIDCIVQDADVKWENKGWKGLTINAKKFVNLVE